LKTKISTWTYEKSNAGLISIYSYNNVHGKIDYVFDDKDIFKNFSNSMEVLDYKLVDEYNDKNALVTNYINSDYEIQMRVIYDAEEKSNLYAVIIVKKNSYFDEDNGPKRKYINGILYDYNLKNGEYDGEFTKYHENGKVSMKGAYKNKMQNGSFYEYDEQGQLTINYTMINGQLHGTLTKTMFEDNKKSVFEKTYKNDKLDGFYCEYLYKNNEQDIKNTGYYINNNKEGTWYLFSINGTQTDTLTVTNYKNGEKDGYTMDNSNDDSLVIAYYKNGKRNGKYILKTDIVLMLTTDGMPIKARGVIAMEGFYKNNERDSLWKIYELGFLSETGYYYKDKRQGIWYTYIIMGNDLGKIITETNYHKGKKSGILKNYYKSKIVEIDEDSKNILYNKVFETITYSNDLKNGEYLQKDTLNNTLIKGQYENDKITGEWIYYDENQKIYLKSLYVDGKIKSKTYFNNDEMFLKEIYENKIKKELEYYRNEKLTEKHKIEFQNDKYKSNVTYISNDSVYIVEYIVNSKDEYDYTIFNTYSILNGKYALYVKNFNMINGVYNNGMKTDDWVIKYPDYNIEIVKNYSNDILVSEIFYNITNSKLANGQLIIKNPEKKIEIINIKNGLRNGKTIFMDNNKEYKVIKYKKGKIVKERTF